MDVAHEGRASFLERRHPFFVVTEKVFDLLGRLGAVHADVDDDGARSDELLADDRCSTHRRNEDLSLARDTGKVLRPGMAYGDRRIGVGQQHRHRLSDDVAPADDDSAFARYLDVLSAQKLHHARRRARPRPGTFLDELADTLGMKPVYVLRGVDAIEKLRRVQMIGQWKLQQDRIDIIAPVELIELDGELLARRLRRHEHGLREKPGFSARFRLAVHVEL